MLRLRTSGLVVTALLALLVTACTPAASPTATPGGAPGTPAGTPAGTPVGTPADTPGATGTPGAVQLPEPEITDIQLGLNGTETSQWPTQLATMAGIYDKYGLNVDVSTFEGDGGVVQAMVAGQLQGATIGVSAAFPSHLTDTPLIVVSVNADVLTDQLVATADVTNAEELRGKQVAVSTFGGTSHGAVILALEAIGLTPDDVVITQIGGQSARIAALEGGAVAAAPIDAALEEEMRAQGFNILTDLKEAGVPWGRSGLTFTQDFLEQNPNTALVLLAGALEAQQMMWEDPETAARHYAEFRQISEEEALELIREFQEVGNRSLMWEPEAFENPQRVLATVTPEVAQVEAEEVSDESLLEQLREMGFYEQVGAPTE